MQKLMSDAMHHNDYRHWILFEMFCQAGLARPPRGGRQARAGTHVSRQLDAWCADPMGLWRRLKDAQSTRKNPGVNSAYARAKRAMEAVEKGQPGRAVRSLEAGGIAPDDARTTEKMKSKHPPALHPKREFRYEDLPPSCTNITDEHVEKCVLSFSPGTACRGLRAQHLKDALKSSMRAEFLRDLTKAVVMWSSGALPPAFAPFVAGATLTALDKTKGGIFDVRPIASGGIFRRLVSKVLCMTNKKTAAAFFIPGQYGVACPSGAERVVHKVRRVVKEQRESKASEEYKAREDYVDFVILKVDLKNAFNKVSRAHVLRLVQKHFPGLARWVHFCYGSEDPFLWLGSAELRSQEGVQQGDPLGPLLFATVIQSLIAEIREKCPNLVLNEWYLDDGVLAGRQVDVLRALGIIQESGPGLGMDLNMSKNEIVKFSDAPDGFPPEFIRFRNNFELLGSPIGDASFCSQFVSNFVKKRVIHSLDSLCLMKNAQTFHYLARLCCSFCKVIHLLRTIPPLFCDEALSFFDASLRKCVSLGLGVLLPDFAWTQATLPISLGGLGLRSAVLHAAGAYLSSVSRSARLDGWDASSACGWNEARADWLRHANLTALPDVVSQHVLSLACDKQTLLSCLSKADALAKPLDMARLRAVSAEGAGLWLGVLPSRSLQHCFDNREFTTLVRWWLGLPVSVAVESCPGCGFAMGTDGYHALTCQTGGGLGVRHNALRDCFLRYCKMAGLEAKKEVAGLLPDSAARPADVLLSPLSSLFIRNLDSRRACCLDFAVTNTLQPKTLSRACVVSGAAAADYEQTVKLPRYKEQCEKQNLDFVPMVVEAYGAWGPCSTPILRFVSRSLAHRKLLDEDRAAGYVRQALSITLQRYNVRTLLKHIDLAGPMVDDHIPDF